MELIYCKILLHVAVELLQLQITNYKLQTIRELQLINHEYPQK